jgi:valyl-tRNA synthetase
MTAPYPRYAENRVDPRGEEQFAFLQELVRSVRTLRSECVVPPEKKIRLLARPAGQYEDFLRENAGLVELLAGVEELEIAPPGKTGDPARPTGSIGLVGSGFEAFVFIAEAVDRLFLKQKFTKEIEKDRAFSASLKIKLSNDRFVKNAPPELVAGERTKLAEALKRAEKLESYIRDMA